MFRKNSPTLTEESSFHSGKASIILQDNNVLDNEPYDHQYFYESSPYQYQYGDNLNRPLPPTPSLERTSTQTTSSSCFSLGEEDHQFDNNSKMYDPLTLESMSAVIAAAVQMSRGGIKSSLSMGHASIKQPQQQEDKVKRRFSLFSWKKQQQQQQLPAEVSPTPSCLTVVDDGRDELAHRGIHIKEIKTTLKPMVIPSNVTYPMPTVTMERPGFARINY